ncbi:hypothetical protein Tco_1352551 [Tanacetum coccineum]
MDALREFDQKRTLFETMTTTKSFERSSKHKTLYHALIESILEDEDAMYKGVADKLKKRKTDDDRDEGPPVGPDQGLKRKKRGKETEPSKKAKSLELPKSPPSLTQNLLASLQKIGSRNHKDLLLQILSGMKISDLTQDILVGSAYELLKGTCMSYVELDYNIEEYYKALTDQDDWNNPEGDRYPFDLSKPLPLIKSRNRQIVLVDYFFNNDLAYLQGENTDRTYTTSLTKIKAAKYDLKGIKDMVPNLWSPIKVAYEKHALLGVIYEDKLSRKVLMRSDELYTFSDGTLQSVWDTIHDMATNLRMGYNKAMPKRIWTHLDKTRSHIMIKEINCQLRERRLMRSLEKFVGGRHYEEDLRLLQRTI